jgi:peroxiredoxin
MPIPGADLGTSTSQTSRSESQRSTDYILVAMIGPCSQCVKGTLEVAEQYALQHPTVRVVAASPSAAKDLRTFRELNRLHLQLVSDPYRKLEHIYNAAWMPRAYLLSAGGSLLWCQTESDFALPPDELVRPRHERE